MEKRERRTQRRNPWKVGLLACALLLLGLVGYEQGSLAIWRASHPSLSTAEWIWSPYLTAGAGPASFYVLRDFDLEEVPSTVELLCQGDEEYLVLVNGKFVGSNRFRDGQPLDRYDISDLLQAGTNRILVELRSSRGLGGFLAAAVSAEVSEPLVVTDDSWGVRRRWRRGLLKGRAFERAAKVHSWGRLPVGRWGLPKSGPLRPRVDQLRLAARDFEPQRVGVWRTGEGWKFSPWRRGAVPKPTASNGSFTLLLDWGRTVVGYPTLDYRTAAGIPPLAVVWFGEQLPSQSGWVANDSLIGAEGSGLTTFSRPHRFRYLLIEGSLQLNGALLLPLDPEQARSILAPVQPTEAGVFGMRSPRSRSSVENEIRRRLESFASVAGGENG